ncbi:MAG: hypothetical protein ABIL58_21820 [Pseudomonadota bacterium]
MVVIPKDKPVISGMNSYYLNINRLIEHFNGEFESGGILFQSPAATGVIFFDDHIPLSGIFESKATTVKGPDAIQHLIDHAPNSNFNVSVFHIDSDMVHFWANLAEATPLYTNLSTEFTDLKALIKKMRSEKLTGYIDACIGGTESTGCIFLNFGHILGGTYAWLDNDLRTETALLNELLKKADSGGGTFSVYKVDLGASPSPRADGAEATDATPAESANTSDDEKSEDAPDDIQMLEEFLNVFEETAMGVKRYRSEFHAMLRKKFISKAEKYDFLDPFAAEFEYADGAIRYNGTASKATVIMGVVESVRDLAKEMGLTQQLITALRPWTDRYKEIISLLDLDI